MDQADIGLEELIDEYNRMSFATVDEAVDEIELVKEKISKAIVKWYDEEFDDFQDVDDYDDDFYEDVNKFQNVFLENIQEMESDQEMFNIYEMLDMEGEGLIFIDKDGNILFTYLNNNDESWEYETTDLSLFLDKFEENYEYTIECDDNLGFLKMFFDEQDGVRTDENILVECKLTFN